MAELASNLSACIEDVSGRPVQVYGGERMGSAADLARSVTEGRLDLAVLPIKRYTESWNEITKFAQLGYSFAPKIAVSYSNDKDALEILNDSSWQTGLELIGVGWQYGALVTGSGDQLLDDLSGKRVAGVELSTRDVLEVVGGDWVQLPYFDVLPALRSGHIDGAVVSEEVLLWGLREAEFRGIYWAPDFSPVAAPIGIIMNKDNDEIFGGMLAAAISEECSSVIGGYNEWSIDLWDEIPTVAAGSNVEILHLSEAWKEVWVEALKMAENGVEGGLEQEILDLVYERYNE